MKLKILSFNWHAPYLCLLSKLDHQFIIVEPEVSPGIVKRWENEMRPLPDNVKLVSTDQGKRELDDGKIDLVLAHNLKDLLLAQGYQIPKILVFHNKLSTEIALSNNAIAINEYLKSVEFLRRDIKEVYISESKRRDWGGNGEIILPGIDVSEYGDYSGEISTILRVGNHFKERDLMLGYTNSQLVAEGFPCITLGINPKIPGAELTKNFEELKEYYRRCRVYLNSTVERYEDGYNLALLEAMATGMPVVSFVNGTSPIVDGLNGFISNDISYLKASIDMLLDNPNKAREMGVKARETIIKQFSLDAFLDKWNKVIHQAILDFLKNNGVTMDSEPQKSFHEKMKKNVLMDFVSYPASTAFYLEKAFRKSHNVITCGSMINNDVIKLWDLENLNWPIYAQDIKRSASTPISEVIGNLPTNWHPDLYLWVETGLDHIPSDLDILSIPKACYLIDTHLHLEQHKAIAGHFDFVFLAQREYIQDLKSIGCKNVYWLPLACDPEIHGKKDVEQKYEIGFVGSITAAHAERKYLLELVDRHFDLFIDRQFMDEMAKVFSQSKIVFNHAIKNDLNMRVFEAMCSGSMLITDRAVGSGLDEIFMEGEHLVIYKNENDLLEKIRLYLNDSEKRISIAESGLREVLAKHTYEHRVKTIIEKIDECFCNGDIIEKTNEKFDQYYHNVREDILPLIDKNADCILDVGCGAGLMGKALKERPGVFVAGIELVPSAAKKARKLLDDVVEGDIETMNIPYDEKSFDCIVAADVLEHLINPLVVLKKLVKCLKQDGSIVASIPNIQFFGVINHLIEGNWTYQKEGILDQTHLRFFTFKEIEKMFLAAGLEITEVSETLDPQYKYFLDSQKTKLKIGRMTIENLSPEEMKRFFVFQYKVVAKPNITMNIQGIHLNEEVAKNQIEKSLLADAKKLQIKLDFKEAMTIYKRVLDKNPYCANAIIGMGDCYIKTHDLSSAEKYYQQGIEFDPNCLDARMGLALLDYQSKNFKGASDKFLQILKKDPENDKAYCGLGLACYQMGNKERAMEYYSCSLELNIENGTAFTSLLNLSYEINQFEKIENAVNNYLELHPANINMLFGLAGIHCKMNRMEEAKETLSRILIFQPEHKDAIKLMEQIEMTALST